MRLGKIVTLNLLAPILRAAPDFVRGAMDDYNETLSDAQKVRQGAIQRSLWVQREGVARMQESPVIVGNFRPIQSDQREAVVLEGVKGSPDVCILLNKADRFNGVLRTRRNPHSLRDYERLDGGLSFDGLMTVPVVLYWTIYKPVNPLRPVVDSVGIGEEGRKGFIWTYRLWSAADGFSDDLGGPVPDGQPDLPGMPAPQVRLRRPDAVETPLRIGTREDDRQNKQKRDAEHDGKKRAGDSA